jgi:hypothetical protein
MTNYAKQVITASIKQQCFMRLFLLFMILPLSISAQKPEWVMTMGDTTSGGGRVFDIKTKGPDVFIVGYIWDSSYVGLPPSTTTLTGEEETPSMFFARLDTSGQVIWVNKLGPGVTWPGMIELDDSLNIIITGVFQDSIDFDTGIGSHIEFGSEGQSILDMRSVFVAKYDSSGNFRWVRTASKRNIGMFSYSTIIRITTDNHGNIYWGGYIHSDTLDIGNEVLIDKSFIEKLSANGSPIWILSVGAIIRDIHTDYDNNIMAVGSFMDSVNFNPLDTVKYLLSKNQIRSDCFLAKYSPSGLLEWVNHFKNGGQSGPPTVLGAHKRSLAVDEHNNIYIGSQMHGLLDIDPDTTEHMIGYNLVGNMMLAKYSSDGKLVWGNHLIAPPQNWWEVFAFWGISYQNGKIYMTGQHGRGITFENDIELSPEGYTGIFISRFDSSGIIDWARSLSVIPVFPQSFAHDALQSACSSGEGCAR